MRATYPISNRLHKGFVDVLSLLIVVFLVATIAMGTKLTTDKNFTANFFSQAKKGVPSDYDVKHAAADAQKAEDKADAAVENATSKNADGGSAAANQKAADALAAAAVAAQDAAKVANDRAVSTGDTQDIQDATNAIHTASTAQFISNVAESKVQDTTTTITPAAAVPAGMCDANGTAYAASSVVVYGKDDYRKCSAGKWVPGASITDLTPAYVPTYLNTTYTQAVTDKNAADAAAAQAAAYTTADQHNDYKTPQPITPVTPTTNTGGLGVNIQSVNNTGIINTLLDYQKSLNTTPSPAPLSAAELLTAKKDCISGGGSLTSIGGVTDCTYPKAVTTQFNVTADAVVGSPTSISDQRSDIVNQNIDPNYNKNDLFPGCPAGSNQDTCISNEIRTQQAQIPSATLKIGGIVTTGIAAVATASVIADAAPAVWALSSGNLAAVPVAAYSYGTAALITAPAAVRTAIGITEALATVITPAVLTQNCVASGDPNSASCQAFIGLRVDPLQTQQSLADSTSTLLNTAKAGLNSAGTAISNYATSGLDDVYGYSNIGNTNSTQHITPSSVIDEYFNGWEALNPLTQRITGHDVNDIALVDKMISDNATIRQEYNLPPVNLRSENPTEYLKQMQQIMDQNGIALGNINDPGVAEYINNAKVSVGGFYDDKFQFYKNPTIVSVPDKSGNVSLPTLDHEFIHAMDVKINPNITIEQTEYNAYVGQLGNPQALWSGDTRSFIFNFNISGSINNYMREQGIPIVNGIPATWINP